MDNLQAIEIIEGPAVDSETVIDAFQQLINTGVVWSLQGSYDRAAANLIESGECHPAGAR